MSIFILPLQLLSILILSLNYSVFWYFPSIIEYFDTLPQLLSILILFSNYWVYFDTFPQLLSILILCPLLSILILLPNYWVLWYFPSTIEFLTLLLNYWVFWSSPQTIEYFGTFPQLWSICFRWLTMFSNSHWTTSIHLIFLFLDSFCYYYIHCDGCISIREHCLIRITTRCI